jgi:hypothetical protein
MFKLTVGADVQRCWCGSAPTHQQILHPHSLSNASVQNDNGYCYNWSSCLLLDLKGYECYPPLEGAGGGYTDITESLISF